MPSFFFHVAFELCCRSSHLPGVNEDTSLTRTQISPTTNIFHLLSSNAQAFPGRHKSSTAQILPSAPPVRDPTLHGEEAIESSGSKTGTQGPRADVQEGLEVSPEHQATVSTRGIRAHDWRHDRISVQSIDMLPAEQKVNNKSSVAGHISNGISAGSGGLATKGRYEATEREDIELGWGIVHLYRDAEETPRLNQDLTSTRNSRNHKPLSRRNDHADELSFTDEDCTTLCVLAVPSYLTPSDFLGFVGETTRDDVSHFRMIRTERVNRYMVLMKFRNGRKAREWRKDWNGKAFNSMEVGLIPCSCVVHVAEDHLCRSRRIATSSLSSPSSFGRRRRSAGKPLSRT